MARRIFLFFLLLLGCLTLSQLCDAKCKWQTSIIQSTALTTETLLIDDAALIDSTGVLDAKGSTILTDIFAAQGGPRSYPYMLRIQPECTDQISVDEARRYAFAGGTPIIHITEDHQILNSEKFHGPRERIYDGALINEEQLLATSTYEIQTLAWVTPLELSHQSSILGVTIKTNGVFSALPYEESHRLGVSGFVNGDGTRPGLLGSTVSAAVSGSVSAPFSITALPHVSPTLAMVTLQSSTSPRYILTEDFFSTYTTLETPTVDASLSTQCTCSDINLLPSHELAVVALPDRLIYVTKKGVNEVLGNMIDKDGARPSTFTSSLVYSGCVRRVETSQQSHQQQRWSLLIIGGCADYNKIFRASYTSRNGNSVSFEEVIDGTGQGVCDASGYASSDCSLLSAAIVASDTSTILALVHHPTSANYTIWKNSAGTWEKQSTVPNLLPSTISTSPYLVSTSRPASGGTFTLTGLTVSQTSPTHIALWGSRLVVSKDSGAHVYLSEDFDGGSNIVQFVSSPQDWYAFLTDLQEVWIGMFGTDSVKKVYPSTAWDMVHYEDTSPVPGSTFTIVSLIFDYEDKLYMMVVEQGGTDIIRLDALLGQILSYISSTEELTSVSSTNIFDEVLTDASAKYSCPFHDVIFEVPDMSWYTKSPSIAYRKPLLYDPSNMHGQGSLLLYQALVYSINQLRDSFSDPKYLRPYYDYLEMWQTQTSMSQGYYSYLFENDLVPSELKVDPNTFSISTRDSVGEPRLVFSLPRLIYMGQTESIFFVTFINMPDAGSLRFLGEEGHIRLGVYVSHTDLLAVYTTQEFLPMNNTVKYEIEIRDLGMLSTQKKPGIDLAAVAVSLSVIGAPFNCFSGQDSLTNSGVHQMSVFLGCPPTQSIVFDALATKTMTQSNGDATYDCFYADPDLPCFYFYNSFYPVFLVMDSATGERRTWYGNYTLKITGGGKDKVENIRAFSTEDIVRYNSLKTGEAALIWSPVSDSYTNPDGWVVYNGNNSGISWFCQAESPCSLIFPKLPQNSEYFFLLEFSNKDVDGGTNCDYTMEFLLHLHGLPLNNIALSAPLVLVAVLFVCAWFCLVYYYEIHKEEFNAKCIACLLRIFPQPEEEEEIDEEQLKMTNEELELLGEKDWKTALKIKVQHQERKLGDFTEDDEEALEYHAVTVDKLKPSETLTKPGPSQEMVQPKSGRPSISGFGDILGRGRRRTSVGLRATFDGRVSIMGGDIDTAEIMRLRTLNRVFLSKEAKQSDDQSQHS